MKYFNLGILQSLLRSKHLNPIKFTTAPFSSSYPGAPLSQFTSKLQFEKDWKIIPTFRILDSDGLVIEKEMEPELSSDTLLKMYKCMITLSTMDIIMYDAQRQGRISFYMTSFGEEATHMGSAAALEPADVIFGQYRESGVLLYRGFTLEEFMNQMYSNAQDYGKGRQMPVHYGKASLNFQTISSPLGTQIPQAAGAAYALKLSGASAVSICYFGDGAASEGDFHAALNMAATTSSPVIFFCRNNGYAISTPVAEQYRGDGIAARGSGYGIETIRVDGNDVLAVYAAIRAARNTCIEHGRPVLVEAMTYRVGHHSTSDDSSAYRTKKEVTAWQAKDSPIIRFRKYLTNTKKIWDDEMEKEFSVNVRKDILKAFSKAEKIPKPEIMDGMFEDVYSEIPVHLIEQKKELQQLIKDYPEHYDTSSFASSKIK